MIPRQYQSLFTGAAIILGGILTLNFASFLNIQTLRLTSESKRRKTALPCKACRGKGFYICQLCQGNATIQWAPLSDPMAFNPCICPTCEGNRFILFLLLIIKQLVWVSWHLLLFAVLRKLSMPKERRDRSVSHDRYRVSPFSCSSLDTCQHPSAMALEAKETAKEWDEARCPVCMEHPHNAVLLICSSHEKGCRPYMCDTSRRHSNCLDQFRKQNIVSSSSMALEEDHQLSTIDSFPPDNSELTGNDLQERRSEEMSLTTNPVSCDNQVQLKIICPLCRGKIISWIVDEPARCFMNEKMRSCSNETCDFSGMYTDLRKHARKEHPLVCPSAVDPERQSNWRRLEQQRDLGDLLSTLNSSFVEDGDDDNNSPIDDNWLPVFFFIRVFQPENDVRIRRWSGTSRSRGQFNSRGIINRLWSENHDLETGSSSRDNDDESPEDIASWGNNDHIPQQTLPDNTP